MVPVKMPKKLAFLVYAGTAECNEVAKSLIVLGDNGLI
jgi:hypothetical protein